MTYDRIPTVAWYASSQNFHQRVRGFFLSSSWTHLWWRVCFPWLRSHCCLRWQRPWEAEWEKGKIPYKMRSVCKKGNLGVQVKYLSVIQEYVNVCISVWECLYIYGCVLEYVEWVCVWMCVCICDCVYSWEYMYIWICQVCTCGCYGWKCVPPDLYFAVLTPQYLKMWPYLEIKSLQRWSSSNEVIRVDPLPVWLVSLSKGKILTQIALIEGRPCEETQK